MRPMPKQPKLLFTFASRVVRLDHGFRFHAVPVPDDAASVWKDAGVRRVEGTLNAHPINRGLQNHADGEAFLIIGQDTLKEFGLREGSEVRLNLWPDPTPNTVDVPVELVIALEQDDEARARWETFTPGKRRSLAHYVTSAKQEATRIRRAVELAGKIRTYSLYGDKPASTP